ncbi:MAG: Chromosome partition protein Smc [Planctomycetota bacterium]|jgi:uncharacterized protein involved in exopolysaccharide biosynthesis
MPSTPNVLHNIIRTMLRWSPLWLATTVASTSLGVLYVTFLKQDMWVASQAVIIRDEVGGTLNRQGRFDNKEAMKAAQETIMEIARNPEMIRQALQSLSNHSEKLPSDEMVRQLLKQFSIRSPKGSEFGTTEIFYIDASDSSKENAIRINTAICDALEKRLQEVRMARYHGIVKELEHSLAIARSQRNEATEKLKEIETEVGQDLNDLRGLTDSFSGGGTVKVQIDQWTNEKRQAEIQFRQLREDISFLEHLQEDPSRVLVAPSTLLNAQPGLKKLCEGLVDSTIQESQLTGRFTSNHPSVKAARVARSTIRQSLGEELRLAKSTLETELRVTEQRIALLDEQLIAGQRRIASLANVRADYANALAEVRNRTTIMEQIERDHSVAEANRLAAAQESLITRLDAPVVGDKPAGPGKKTLICLSILAGFLSGIGLVLLLAPIDLGIRHGRRWSDHIYAASQAALQLAPNSSPIHELRNSPAHRSAMNTASSALSSVADSSPAPTACNQESVAIRTNHANPEFSPSSQLSSPQPIIAQVEADSIKTRQNSSENPINYEGLTKSLAEIAESLSPAPQTSGSANPTSLSQLASETDRRTKPRRPPAAIFANFQDNQTPTSVSPSKLAT